MGTRRIPGNRSSTCSLTSTSAPRFGLVGQPRICSLDFVDTLSSLGLR